MDVNFTLYSGVTHSNDNLNLNIIHESMCNAELCGFMCHNENLQSKNIIQQNSLLLGFFI